MALQETLEINRHILIRRLQKLEEEFFNREHQMLGV
jgi:hypothetical protein